MKRVVIIGAGASGLPAIKSCLEEGLDPVCFEMTPFVGGLWNYQEEQCPGRATVYRGVITNTSKEMTSYSDFPQPIINPTFLPNHLMAKYLHDYAEYFHLRNYIKMEHQVMEVNTTDDHSLTGKWNVRVRDLVSSEEFEEVFDAVIVCNGHNWSPKWPNIPGGREFQGKQIHSQQYRKPEVFEGKTVVVVGFGNSGCEIATECATVAKKVYFATRGGGWVLPKTLDGGHPIDTVIGRRVALLLLPLIPLSIRSFVFEKKLKNLWDLELYGIRPSFPFHRQFPVLNDSFVNEVICGRVEMVNNISHFTETGVFFESGLSEHPIDCIIYGTGYRPHCPFLEGVLNVEDEIRQIYKMVFPISQSQNTLAFVGLVDSDSSPFLTPIELQCRWIARVLSGSARLPSKNMMEDDCRRRVKNLQSQYVKGSRVATAIRGLAYCEELATLIGAKPSLFSLFFKDQRLFWACLTSPLVPAQYRLKGPHSWSGARDIVLNYEVRFVSHVKRRGKQIKKCKGFTRVLWLAFWPTLFLAVLAGKGLWGNSLEKFCNLQRFQSLLWKQ